MRSFTIIAVAGLLYCAPISCGSGEPRGSASNYINLHAEVVDSNGTVRLTYSCDYSAFDYGGKPVHVYLMALGDPLVSDCAASVHDTMSSGTVQFFRTGMVSVYTYAGVVGLPTFGAVTFPDAPSSGSLLIDTVGKNISPGTLAFAALLMYVNTGDYVRNDGLPVAISNTVAPFRYHAAMIPSTIHVGDGYDPYMATWEVTHPEGIVVRRTFVLDTAPTGVVVVRGETWGTYYSSNPMYINGKFITYFPGQLNGNNWNWVSGRLSPALFHQGTNTITFKSSLYRNTGHWDNYMAKGWEIFYN